MRVLLIYPNQSMTTRAPLGIGYLSSFLKNAGHDMKLLDYTFIKCGDAIGDDALREKNLQVSNPDFDKHGLVEKKIDIFYELEKEIEEYKPGLIAMSTVDPNHNFGMKLLNHCKNKYPKIKILVGGPLATLVPNDILNEECVDIVGIGEAEESLVELCNNLESKNYESIYKTKNMWVKDLNYAENKKVHKNIAALPNIEHGLAPDLGIFDDRHFLRPLGGKIYRMATVIWTRGCVFHCSYCANETFYRAYNAIPKQYYRKKDALALVDELAEIKKTYNLNFLFFVDDIWPMHDVELVKKFCDAYKKKVDLPFSVNLQCKLINEKAFEIAVDAGLSNICVGVESGSENVRRKILKRNYKDADVVRAFDLAHKHKIRSSSFNIIGLPHETRDDIFKTIELNREAKPDSATVTFFHPYRGAPLRKLCVEEGLINAEDSKHEDMYRTESQLNMPQITKKELSNLMQAFQLYFKLPKKFWPLIKESEDTTSEKGQKIREDILLPAFREVLSKETKFDFTKNNRKPLNSFLEKEKIFSNNQKTHANIT
tara:strand:+ start:476 stop:2101 length:1626 start_codon:yes stop_codon:yes gene_type:complete